MLSPAAAASPGTTCSTGVLDAPGPASAAVRRLAGEAQRHVAALNHLTVERLHDLAGSGPQGDDTFWLDRCGRGLYAEETAPAATGAPAPAAGQTSPATAEGSTATGPAGPLGDTFGLASNPGASRTIYLDFDGQSVSGTAWNNAGYGTSGTITAPAYTADADPAFSTGELTQIQRAWMVVAEDYAPYDVNVTTRDPGADALERSSSADPTYGVRVVVTADGPIYDYCRCGGIAYVGIYGDPGMNAYQPAWVFTDGVGTDGVTLAQAVSHEVGHTLGLSHDGTATQGYYTGTQLWAPIMGASYYSPVTQWSRGEYPGANNHEDDIAVITRVLGLERDDRADGLAGAEALPAGTTTQRDGVIGTSTDVDAFTLTTGALTTVSAQPTGLQADLDIALTITDAGTGQVLARVDPAAGVGTGPSASGLGAEYRLPAGPTRTYLFTIDGVGNGDPAVAGRYSDYGSEGAYRLTVTSGAQPLRITAPSAVSAVVGQDWETVLGHALDATGGVAPYTWSASGLPLGAILDRLTGLLRGTITTAGSWAGSVTVTDAAGLTATAATTFVVTTPPAPPALTTATPPAQTRPAAPRWTKATLRRAKVRRSYRDALTVTGGAGTLRWTLVGTLPSGIRLTVADNGHRLVLKGRASRTGSWRVRLVGFDRAGHELARTVRLAVRR
jgi:hypothetical protein